MATNQFFIKKGPYPLNKILHHINSKALEKSNKKIYDIKDLVNSTKNDITFLNSGSYQRDAIKTKAVACITYKKFSKYLPSNCIKIIVKDVLLSVNKVSSLFYPMASVDYLDKNLKDSSDLKKKYFKVTFGKNVLIGSNVKIGKFSIIGSNSIIESNVVIGNNCIIGSSVIIKNSVIKDNVCVNDNAVIGKKGFGFIPSNKKNLKTPQIGKVIIENGVEIGCACTLDRGSLSDTVIGENTFLDNQIHIAHNVRIGKNCILAGQVGVAGSTVIGDNVSIGGQAGISGHLKIGNNVKIGGGSGVINNVPDNLKVMGYPAVPLKDFIKQRHK